MNSTTYQGQIKPNNQKTSYYWFVSLPVVCKDPSVKSLEFLFDSGTGRGVSLNTSLFDKIGSDITIIETKFTASRSYGKYQKYNVIGLDFLQKTKTAILKDKDIQNFFKLILNPQLNPKDYFYKKTIDGFSTGCTYLYGISVKFINSIGSEVVQNRDVIFDTGAGFDYYRDTLIYIRNDNKYVEAKIQPNFSMMKIIQQSSVNQDLVGPRVFRKKEIGFWGINDKQLTYWIGS